LANCRPWLCHHFFAGNPQARRINDGSIGARRLEHKLIRHDTTFVVGAGASFDYGFSLGEQLTKQIAEAFNMNDSGGSQARELIRTTIDVVCRRPDMQRDPRQLFLQARALRAALLTASSIDAFLDNHSDNPDFGLLGKIAIAACLITAEQRSQLKLKPRHPGEMIDLAGVEKSWLARLFKIVMTPGVQRASIEQMFAHVKFVIFNYDRCIEHYFRARHREPLPVGSFHGELHRQEAS
jgi:hypothetical protein